VTWTWLARIRLALAFLGFILLGLGSGAAGVLIPYQMADYQVDKVVIGLTFFAFSGGYVLSGLSNGMLINRLGTRGQLTLGAAAYLVTAFGIGLRPAFPVLLAASVVAGFGTGVLDSGLNAYVTTLPGHVALLNYLHAFFGVGALLGPLLATELVTRQRPWQDTYLVLAAVSVPVLIGFAVALPRRVGPLPDGHPSGAPLAAVLRHPAVWLAALFLGLYVGIEVTVGNWSFSLLKLAQGQADRFAGGVVAGYWLGLTLGRFLLNALVARLGLSVSTMMYACVGGVIAATLVTWWSPGVLVGALGFALIGFFLGPVFPTVIAVTPQLLPGRLVSTAVGLLVGASVVGGSFLPWLAGAVAEGFGLPSLLPYLLVLAVIQVGGWWTIAHQLHRPIPVTAPADPPASSSPVP
jgi:fucose permease